MRIPDAYLRSAPAFVVAVIASTMLGALVLSALTFVAFSIASPLVG